MDPSRSERRALYWLAAGALAGLALAAAGLVELPADPTSLPEGAIARVNGHLIQREDYARLVTGVERDTREPATPALEERLLDRMIEEELLLQRALELGLARADRRVRANLVSGLIGSVTGDAEQREPTREELLDFFAAEAPFFTKPARLRVRQIFFSLRGPDAMERARSALARLHSGAPFATVRRELGDEELSALPDALLPPQKLLQYLGPTVLETVRALRPGELGGPVQSGTGIHVLELVAREDDRVPDYEDVAGAVRAEWTRRQGERALREYIDRLASEAEIVR